MRGKVSKFWLESQNFMPGYLKKKVLNIKRQSVTWDTLCSVNRFKEFLGYVTFYFSSLEQGVCFPVKVREPFVLFL